MSDPKAERLINLTMALLATRRYLTKTEIFRTVAGYSGTSEAMERMFERDKNDLRELGITIELGNLDELFEDEQGYRIREDSYALDIGEISPEELALISIAVQTWRSEFLSESAQSAIRKLNSMGVATSTASFELGVFASENPHANFDVLWEAIANRKEMTFTYTSETYSIRRIQPYGISLWRGFWYLVGQDLTKSEIRVFKLIRVSDVKIVGRSGAYEIPQGFDLRKFIIMKRNENPKIAQLHIRKGKGQIFRNLGTVESINDDWDSVEVNYTFIDGFISQILWHGTDVKIQSPGDLITALTQQIAEKIS